LHFLQIGYVKRFKRDNEGKEDEVPGVTGIARGSGGFYTLLGEAGMFVDSNALNTPYYDEKGPCYRMILDFKDDGKGGGGRGEAFAIVDAPAMGKKAEAESKNGTV
jgi:hypothetical protein